MRTIRKHWKRILVLVLAACMITAGAVSSAMAEEETDGGKYLSDLFIAYGDTEEEASVWLEDNGWDPMGGELPGWITPPGYDVPVLGIRRTDDRAEAITDIAILKGPKEEDGSQGRLLLYAEKDPDSAPILADTLALQQESGETSGQCLRSLYVFGPGTLNDTHEGENEAVALSWDTEEDGGTPSIASAFTGGQLALIGTVGLVVGVLGATMVLLPKRKKIWVDENGNM